MYVDPHGSSRTVADDRSFRSKTLSWATRPLQMSQSRTRSSSCCSTRISWRTSMSMVVARLRGLSESDPPAPMLLSTCGMRRAMNSLVVDRQPKPLETATMLMMRPRPHRLGVVESVEEEGVEEVVAMAKQGRRRGRGRPMGHRRPGARGSGPIRIEHLGAGERGKRQGLGRGTTRARSK